MLSRLHLSPREVFEQITQSGLYIGLGVVGASCCCATKGCTGSASMDMLVPGSASEPLHQRDRNPARAPWPGHPGGGGVVCRGLTTLCPEREEERQGNAAMWWWRAATVPTGILLFLVSSGIVRTGVQISGGWSGTFGRSKKNLTEEGVNAFCWTPEVGCTCQKTS